MKRRTRMQPVIVVRLPRYLNSRPAKAIGIGLCVVLLSLSFQFVSSRLIGLGDYSYPVTGPRVPLGQFLTGARDRQADSDMSECEVPRAPSDERLYSRLEEQDLPWFGDDIKKLADLRVQTRAARLLAAFRTTLPDPILQEAYNVKVAAGYLAGTIIPPDNVFSLQQAIGPFSRDRGYGDGPTYMGTRIVPSVGGGVCKIASTLYNVVMFSDLPVIQRHPHSMLVPYVPAGRDATIASGYKDFQFRNDRDTPVLIWAEMKGTTLYIAFYGQFQPPDVQWRHEELSRSKTWTVRRYNPKLEPGEEDVVLEGYDGVTVHTWITVTYPEKDPEIRDLGTDSYRAMPRVVEYGPRRP